MQTKTFHEDVFYKYFRPFRHDKSEFDIWGGLGLQTWGHDLHLARTYPAEYVWSVLDDGQGPNQWIAPGIRYANQVCHVLTEVPHDCADVAFLAYHDFRPLTVSDLKRRLSTLRNTLLMQGVDSKERLDAALSGKAL